MYSICLRYHSDVNQANEALQRSFIKVFEKLESFKSNGNLGGWIRTIIVRTCIDLIKEQQDLKYDDLDQITNLSIHENEAVDDYHDISYSEMIELLNQLPIGYRTVFSLYILDKLKHDEIATTLNISVTTSRSQLFKARKMMKDLVLNNFKKHVYKSISR